MNSTNINERFGSLGGGWGVGRIHPRRLILYVHSLTQHLACEVSGFRSGAVKIFVNLGYYSPSYVQWPLTLEDEAITRSRNVGQQTPTDGTPCPKRTETSPVNMYRLQTALPFLSWIKQEFCTMTVTPYWEVFKLCPVVLMFAVLYWVLTMLRCHRSFHFTIPSRCIL